MREILFRLKINGQWAYGLPHKIRNNTVDFEGEFEAGQRVYEALADNKTLGQYTGLTDKNGKKIFEGDVVEFDGDGKRDTVIWGSGEYNQVNGFRLKRYPLFSITVSNHALFEVIGNIYDNPELLEEV